MEHAKNMSVFLQEPYIPMTETYQIKKNIADCATTELRIALLPFKEIKVLGMAIQALM